MIRTLFSLLFAILSLVPVSAQVDSLFQLAVSSKSDTAVIRVLTKNVSELRDQMKLEEALSLSRKAEVWIKGKGLSDYSGPLLTAKGITYEYLNQLDSAKYCYEQSAQFFLQTIRFKRPCEQHDESWHHYNLAE